MDFELFYIEFEERLFDAEDEALLKITNSRFNPSIDSNSYEDNSLPKTFLRLYNKTNGLQIEWKATNIEQAYGNVEFVDMDTVLGSWEGQVYEKEDLQYNELLEHYHPFDMVAPEFSCGFVIDPETGTWQSIYLNTWGERETRVLDLDFEGYVTMLYESRAYKNWPIILLDLQNGNDDSELIKEFKTDMPQIFPDFDWEQYIAKYESLRLSKKE